MSLTTNVGFPLMVSLPTSEAVNPPGNPYVSLTVVLQLLLIDRADSDSEPKTAKQEESTRIPPTPRIALNRCGQFERNGLSNTNRKLSSS